MEAPPASEMMEALMDEGVDSVIIPEAGKPFDDGTAFEVWRVEEELDERVSPRNESKRGPGAGLYVKPEGGAAVVMTSAACSDCAAIFDGIVPLVVTS